MFEKVPYGVKVRVRGNEEDGFVAEYAIRCNRFFPFMDTWMIIPYYSPDYRVKHNTHPTLEEAKEAAMKGYNEWVDFYKKEELLVLKKKRFKASPAIWKHP